MITRQAVSRVNKGEGETVSSVSQSETILGRSFRLCLIHSAEDEGFKLDT